MADNDQTDLTALTVELLSAYFASNTVPSESLSDLIKSTHSALAGIGVPAPVEPDKSAFTPAVSVRKSLASREHIISLVDGKPYKTLKRHLATKGLTPVEYRQRYNLPADYPMVAPSYSEQRRVVAAKYGLGRSPVKPATGQKATKVDQPNASPKKAIAKKAAALDATSPAVSSPAKVVAKSKPAAKIANSKKDAAPVQGTPGSVVPKPRRTLKIKIGDATTSEPVAKAKRAAAKPTVNASPKSVAAAPAKRSKTVQS